jgi:hypothetical protein
MRKLINTKPAIRRVGVTKIATTVQVVEKVDVGRVDVERMDVKRQKKNRRRRVAVSLKMRRRRVRHVKIRERAVAAAKIAPTVKAVHAQDVTKEAANTQKEKISPRNRAVLQKKMRIRPI